jgi:chaperonin GroES
MKVQPLGERILVQRIEAEEKTAGGIVVPETAKEKPKEGKIISLGTGKVNDKGEKQPFDVKEGDRILFESYAGTEVKIDGEEYLIMKEDDILGIIK